MFKISKLTTPAAASLLLSTLFISLGTTSAEAAPDTLGSIVSDDPWNRSPHVLDGRVLSIEKVGNQIVLGGTFTSARNDTRNDPSGATLERSNLLSFDADTGVISEDFVPDTNGTVNVVIPAADGESVYVGGSFTEIAGQAVKNLARVRISDGSLVTSFNGGSPAGQVKDLRLSGGRLWVAGSFTHIAGKQQKALATLNPQTGAFDTFARPVVAGTHRGGYTTVAKIDVNPAGTKLVAVGNFTTVDGAPRYQMVVLNTGGANAEVSDLRTNFYTAGCSSSFDSYMRDVDVSPDGSFFVASTTGAYGGAGSPCDSTARFEIDASGSDVKPSWVNNTGGDTTYAVEITDAVVYTGGHARWQNNPFGSDRPGQGAVDRPGIAALDPSNGLPYTWNPTRSRGVGVFDMLVTSHGLWVGSDTERIGANEYHGRIALLPAEGGTNVAVTRPASLPNDVYTVNALGSISKRSVSAAGSFGSGTSTSLGSWTWMTFKGGFTLNGQFYSAWSNGQFTRRTFNGTTMGSAVQVNTADLLTNLSDWDADAARITGMFYDNGRIYFARSDQNALQYRYFTPESDVIGARRLQASVNFAGLDLRSIKGMFLADGKLYIAESNGNLARWDWNSGAESGSPVAGSRVVVSGPGVDGINWSSNRPVTLFQDADGHGPTFPPTANIAAECTDADCLFDGSGSTSPGSTIESYAWDFGDGSHGTGVAPQHAYDQSGTYTVKLTVTTSKGGTATASRTVTVEKRNQAPTAALTVACEETACEFDASGSSDSDGQVVSYAWDFGDGDVSNQAQPTHTYAQDGTYHVTLTVTDDQGSTASAEKDVSVARAAVAAVDAASSNGNRTAHSTSVPADAAVGDRLVAFLTLNSSSGSLTAPSGWTEADTRVVDGLTVSTWTKTAEPSDLGGTVRFTTTTTLKSDLTVAAYRSTTGATAVPQVVSVENPRSSTEYVSGPVPVSAAGSLVAHYWGMKTSSDLVLSVQAGLQTRIMSAGAGGGRVYATLADRGAVSSAGDAVQAVATSDVAATRAASVAVVVAPE